MGRRIPDYKYCNGMISINAERTAALSAKRTNVAVLFCEIYSDFADVYPCG